MLPGTGSRGQRALTMAMIREAFHDTDFSVPTLNIQPEHDVTLVNLPTFFEVQFPDGRLRSGRGRHPRPGAPARLPHRGAPAPQVRHLPPGRPDDRADDVPRRSAPDRGHPGDLPTPGTHEVRVDIVYTGQFRVGGSQWFDIPGQVDLQGTPVTLTVREATSRLYTN